MSIRLSTLGIKLGYAVETVAGTKPTAFKNLPCVNKIGGIKQTNDKIDVTCFDDKEKHYVQGMSDNGGDWPITFQVTDELADDWDACVSAAETAKAAGKAMWWDVYVPNHGSYFVIAEPGELPMPELEPNSKMETEVTNTINEYKGMGDAIEPTATSE